MELVEDTLKEVNRLWTIQWSTYSEDTWPEVIYSFGNYIKPENCLQWWQNLHLDKLMLLALVFKMAKKSALSLNQRRMWCPHQNQNTLACMLHSMDKNWGISSSITRRDLNPTVAAKARDKAMAILRWNGRGTRSGQSGWTTPKDVIGKTCYQCTEPQECILYLPRICKFKLGCG